MTHAGNATVHWSKVVCKQPGNYLMCPTIAQKADGELLVVFSGDREEHVCPFGKSQIVRSQDGGETWSEPETINNTPIDDRDAGIIVLRSGTIVMAWLAVANWDRDVLSRAGDPPEVLDAWMRHRDKTPAEAMAKSRGYWTRRSTDGGRTWEPAVDSKAFAPHGPIELQDGRLLYASYTWPSAMIGLRSPLDDPSVEVGDTETVAAESTDEGRSWRIIGKIPVPTMSHDRVNYSEPHVVEAADGRLVCLSRYEPPDPELRPEEVRDRANGDWYLRQSESTDGGRTWSEAQKTPIWGFPPHLLRLYNEDILVTYGHRRPPYGGARACLSHDGGRTWDIDNEIVLRDDAAPPGRDLGYPATVELEPNELLTVYYQPETAGEKPCVQATRWSLT